MTNGPESADAPRRSRRAADVPVDAPVGPRERESQQRARDREALRAYKALADKQARSDDSANPPTRRQLRLQQQQQRAAASGGTEAPVPGVKPAAAPTAKAAPAAKTPEGKPGKTPEAKPAKAPETKPAKTPEAKPAKETEKKDYQPMEPAQPFNPTEPPVMHAEDTIAGRAQRFLLEVTDRMGVKVDVYVDDSREDNLYIHMVGDTLGILIGRRGETLDALQYLTSLQVNKGREGYIRVTLDTENYRAKREDSLRRLAQRMANRAQKTGRKVVLEPMNPYERRVLHTALQNHPGVTTHSEGEEPNRRVVIMLAGQPEKAEKAEKSEKSERAEGKSSSRRSRSRRSRAAALHLRAAVPGGYPAGAAQTPGRQRHGGDPCADGTGGSGHRNVQERALRGVPGGRNGFHVSGARGPDARTPRHRKQRQARARHPLPDLAAG